MTVQARISDKSRKLIREMIDETGENQIAIIEHAVLTYHRERRMRKINEAYEKLKQNKRSWNEELRERSIFN
jgi:hypothetical protein